MSDFGDFRSNREGVRDLINLFILMLIIGVVFFIMDRYIFKKKDVKVEKKVVKEGVVEDTLGEDGVRVEEHKVYILKNRDVSIRVSDLARVKEIKLIKYSSVRLNYKHIVKGLLSFYSLERTKGVVLFKGDGFYIKDFVPDSVNVVSVEDTAIVYRIFKDTISFEKSLVLRGSGFVLRYTVPVKNLHFGGLNTTEPDVRSDLSYFRFCCKTDDRFFTYSAKKLKTPRVIYPPVQWYALTTKYFTIVTEPDDFDSLVVYSRDRKVYYDISFKKDGSQLTMYVLPLKENVLVSYDKGFERLIPAGGILKPITYILFKLLQLFYSIFKNYGVAIVFFSFTMKAIFFPLTFKSLTSAKKMKAIQSKIEELRKKYKDDPQRLNREIMDLYKTHGVNPLSGCLPLLIQLPIFFALYSVLKNSFEMRGSPFVLWIQDLSLRDPYYILPILMGISSVLQSYISNPDPKQRFFQIFMPIMVTIIFLNFPSGLQLYWFIYNVLSLVENFMIHRGGIRWKKSTYQQA